MRKIFLISLFHFFQIPFNEFKRWISLITRHLHSSAFRKKVESCAFLLFFVFSHFFIPFFSSPFNPKDHETFFCSNFFSFLHPSLEKASGMEEEKNHFSSNQVIVTENCNTRCGRHKTPIIIKDDETHRMRSKENQISEGILRLPTNKHLDVVEVEDEIMKSAICWIIVDGRMVTGGDEMKDDIVIILTLSEKCEALSYWVSATNLIHEKVQQWICLSFIFFISTQHIFIFR